jgi:hypothetical protein
VSNNTGIEKRPAMSIKERGQYALAFGVIALMLYAVGFPVFLLVFFGVLAFFVWKVFTAEARNETRRIFEFYLAAHEILRDDERRWYGFEIKDAITRGEAVVRSMTSAPPLVHFALGSLYRKLGDHSSAVRNLAHVVDNASADEASIVFPTKDLREYVRMLRKIERAPAEAPLTSAAIRSLERARKNKAGEMLDHSRNLLAAGVAAKPELDAPQAEPAHHDRDTAESDLPLLAENMDLFREATNRSKPEPAKKPTRKKPGTERQTISEVLHDIYDKNVH